MKLVILISSLTGGGAERVTAHLSSYWARKGWQVTVLTLASVSSDTYALDERVVVLPLDRMGSSSGVLSGLWQNVRRLLAIRTALKVVRPDAVIAMMTTSNVLVALASLGLPLLAVGSERVHPVHVTLPTAWEKLRPSSYALLDAVVALTSKTASWLRANTYARRVDVIPNPVLWPVPASDPFVDPGHWLKPGSKRILAAGRLTSQKGFDLLLRAFARIAARFPDWDLVIVGEGAERDELQRLVLTLGLDRRVVMPGRVGNIGDWYASVHLYVLASRFEGFPNALIEAMACGLPAVSFDCETGPSDIVRPGVDGFLVPVGDLEALADRMSEVMSDDTLRTRLSAAAVEVRERFSIQRIADRWEAVIRRRTAVQPKLPDSYEVD